MTVSTSGTPEVSVILPTLRPMAARRCIERIAATSGGVDYEVVVISPTDMAEHLAGCRGYERICFVRELAKDGSCKANTLGWENARGKYVFAIADDHLLAPGCLRALVEFMRPHDGELFLAGARCYALTGPGEEHTVYGKYYPYTPCIRRDAIEGVGGFYDPQYKCYWGDPDLAMRVWNAGGRAELCRDAWVEFHNAEDALAEQSVNDYARRDYETFVARWHARSGRGEHSAAQADINIRNPYVLGGLPPEACTRLRAAIIRLDWSRVRRELRDTSAFVTRQYLPELLAFAAGWHRVMPMRLRRELADWFVRRLVGLSADDAGPPTEKTFAVAAMFLLTTSPWDDSARLAVESVAANNIIHYEGRYYAWPQAWGGFAPSRREDADVSAGTLWSLMCRLNYPDWEKVRAVENALGGDGRGVEHIARVPMDLRLELAGWIVASFCPARREGLIKSLARESAGFVLAIGLRILVRCAKADRVFRLRKRIAAWRAKRRAGRAEKSTE